MYIVLPDPAIPRHMIHVGFSPIELSLLQEACSLTLGVSAVSMRCARNWIQFYAQRLYAKLIYGKIRALCVGKATSFLYQKTPSSDNVHSRQVSSTEGNWTTAEPHTLTLLTAMIL